MTFLKKQGAAFYFNAVAIVFAIVGIVTMVMSSTYSEANVLAALTRLVIQGVLAVVLVAGGIWAANKGKDDNGIIGLAATMAAIALIVATIGNIINSRILLISGLFSFNSQNMVGWHVFLHHRGLSRLLCRGHRCDDYRYLLQGNEVRDVSL